MDLPSRDQLDATLLCLGVALRSLGPLHISVPERLPIVLHSVRREVSEALEASGTIHEEYRERKRWRFNDQPEDLNHSRTG